MYKVIKYFVDLQDSNFRYNVGDIYPREGYDPTEERIAELSGSENKQKRPLIEVAEKQLDSKLKKINVPRKSKKIFGT